MSSLEKIDIYIKAKNFLVFQVNILILHVHVHSILKYTKIYIHEIQEYHYIINNLHVHRELLSQLL